VAVRVSGLTCFLATLAHTILLLFCKTLIRLQLSCTSKSSPAPRKSLATSAPWFRRGCQLDSNAAVSRIHARQFGQLKPAASCACTYWIVQL
jgi:hypothetical protein